MSRRRDARDWSGSGPLSRYKTHQRHFVAAQLIRGIVKLVQAGDRVLGVMADGTLRTIPTWAAERADSLGLVGRPLD